MTKYPFYLIFFLFSISTFCQITIDMEKVGGVYMIPCKVNNLPLKFILDTGASDVSISQTEALFMIKNGYLNENDIGEKEYYRLANGSITEGVTINLKSIEIGGIKIENIRASIVLEQKAPLLLGQSVLEKIGTYKIVGHQLILEDYNDNRKNALSILDEKNGFKSIKIGSHYSEFKSFETNCFKNEDDFICQIMNAPDELLTVFNKKMDALVLIFDIKTELLKEIKLAKIYTSKVTTEIEAKNSSHIAVNDQTYLITMFSSVFKMNPKLVDQKVFELAGKIGDMAYWNGENISLNILFEMDSVEPMDNGGLKFQYNVVVSYNKNGESSYSELLKKF